MNARYFGRDLKNLAAHTADDADAFIFGICVGIVVGITFGVLL